MAPEFHANDRQNRISQPKYRILAVFRGLPLHFLITSMGVQASRDLEDVSHPIMAPGKFRQRPTAFRSPTAEESTQNYESHDSTIVPVFTGCHADRDVGRQSCFGWMAAATHEVQARHQVQPAGLSRDGC